MTTASPDILFPSAAGRAPRPDDPRADILLGAAVASVFFVGLCGWAAFAPMDAATSAPGVVVVSGHRQTIQSRDGGTISALLVKEGDHVQAGQVLVQFASADAQAQERALTTRVIGLKAEIARLQAQEADQATIVRPADFAQLSPADAAIADQAMALETRTLRAAYGADSASRAMLLEREAEADRQIEGSQRQLEANARQYALNADELRGMQDLAAKGYAPMTRVRALQQSAAGLEGDAGAQTAEIARLRAVAGEARSQISQTQSARLAQIEDQVRTAQSELEQAAPQLSAARDQLARTDIKAPVSGSVVGLAANTVGGVAGAGQKLMDIEPDKLPMVVEAQIAPRDATDLRSGLGAQVRLTGLHSRRAPVLSGTLSRISADSMVDQRTGQAYFTADITVSQQELARLSDIGEDPTLRAGMPADVVIPLRKRTALQYWLEPLTQTLTRSFHEQ